MKEETKALFDKAARAIKLAEKILRDSDQELDFAAGRAYYAMFYIAKGLLLEKGLSRFTKHRAVHSAYVENFSRSKVLDPKYHRWMIDAFDKRLQDDYEAYSNVTSEDVQSMLQQAREFLDAATGYLKQIK